MVPQDNCIDVQHEAVLITGIALIASRNTDMSDVENISTVVKGRRTLFSTTVVVSIDKCYLKLIDGIDRMETCVCFCACVHLCVQNRPGFSLPAFLVFSKYAFGHTQHLSGFWGFQKSEPVDMKNFLKAYSAYIRPSWMHCIS